MIGDRFWYLHHSVGNTWSECEYPLLSPTNQIVPHEAGDDAANDGGEDEDTDIDTNNYSSTLVYSLILLSFDGHKESGNGHKIK